MVTNIKFKHTIVDSSVIISYLMVDETTLPEHLHQINLHLHHKLTLCAPLLLPFEVGNSLRSAVHSKRISPSQATELFTQFKNLEISLAQMSYTSILPFAINHDLSFYDASYLALAKKLKCPLLTLDKNILKLMKI